MSFGILAVFRGLLQAGCDEASDREGRTVLLGPDLWTLFPPSPLPDNGAFGGFSLEPTKPRWSIGNFIDRCCRPPLPFCPLRFVPPCLGKRGDPRHPGVR